MKVFGKLGKKIHRSAPSPTQHGTTPGDPISGQQTPSALNPGRWDDITRGYTLLQLISPMFMILTALHTLQVPSNASNEKLNHNAHDLYHAGTQSEVRNLGQHEGQGTVPNKPSEGIPEPTSDDEQSGKGTQRPVPPRRFRGKSCSPGDTIASIDTYQTRRKTRRMRY